MRTGSVRYGKELDTLSYTLHHIVGTVRHKTNPCALSVFTNHLYLQAWTNFRFKRRTNSDWPKPFKPFPVKRGYSALAKRIDPDQPAQSALTDLVDTFAICRFPSYRKNILPHCLDNYLIKWNI